MPRTQYIDEPNMIIPLAASYNTRGLEGYTSVVTNSKDQRKVNCVYEAVRNPMTGSTTLYVAKRPGVVALLGGGSFGVSSQIPYLIISNPSITDPAPSNFWIVNASSSGQDVRITNFTASSVNLTTAVSQHFPQYVDYTNISGVRTVFVQVKSASSKLRTWHSSTLSGFTEITDGTYTGLTHRGKAEWLDGYLFQSTPDRIYNSDLNTFSSWSDIGYIERRSQLSVGTGLGRLGNQIISWGHDTMEVYRNAGTPFGSPLEHVPSLTQNYGLPFQSVNFKRHYYAILADNLYWVGSNPHGVFAYNGSRVEKVSTPAIDSILAEQPHYFVSAVSELGKNAIAIGLELPTSSTQRALMFFPEWRDWFEWTSDVFSPTTLQGIGNAFMGAFGNGHSVFGVSTASLSNNWRDAGTDYTMTLQFKLPANGNAHQRLQMFGVKADTAASTTTSNLQVRFSFDDWQTSTAARTIDLTKAQKRITRCGGYRDLGVYLDHTGNLDCRLEAVVARVE